MKLIIGTKLLNSHCSAVCPSFCLSKPWSDSEHFDAQALCRTMKTFPPNTPHYTPAAVNPASQQTDSMLKIRLGFCWWFSDLVSTRTPRWTNHLVLNKRHSNFSFIFYNIWSLAKSRYQFSQRLDLFGISVSTCSFLRPDALWDSGECPGRILWMVEERPAKRARNGSPADDSADFNVSMEDIFGDEDVTQSGLNKAWPRDETWTFVRVWLVHLVFCTLPFHPQMFVRS